jgi:ATP-dependent protease ClpP protease subunit
MKMNAIENIYANEEYINNSVQKVQSTSITYTFNLDSDIEEPEEYRSMYHILLNASERDMIVININTDGGILDTALQLSDYLKKTNAHTVANVYKAHSAGSVIMLSCREIILTEFSTAMVHGISSGYYGKQHELKNHGEFFNKFYENFIKKTYRGFLTQEEIKCVIEGKDIWLDCNQLKKKLDNYFNFIEEENRRYEEKLNGKKNKKNKKKK